LIQVQIDNDFLKGFSFGRVFIVSDHMILDNFIGKFPFLELAGHDEGLHFLDEQLF
jgi:hypothetical protein